MVLELYKALQLLRDREEVTREEIGDAAVWATGLLGGEFVERVRDATTWDALVLLESAVAAASTVSARDLKAPATLALLNEPKTREAITLSLVSCAFNPKAIAALGGDWPNLRELAVDRCRLKVEQLEKLLAAPVMANIERLDVSANQLRADGAALLANTDKLPALRAIDLGYTRMETDDIDRIVNGPATRNLRGLHLGTDKHGSELGRILAEGKSLANLRGISMYSNKIGNAGFAKLVGDPIYRELRRLLVFECGIGESGIAALASSPAMEQLAELRFRYDPITGKSLRVLAESEHLGNLRRLQISQCRLDPMGLEALAQSSLALEYLNLGTNPGMGSTIALPLLGRAPNLKNLRHLIIDGLPFGDAGLASLEDDWFPNLETLSIQNTKITDDGLENLAGWARTPKLRRLSIGTNTITNAGLDHLARLPDKRLEFLECWQCGVTIEHCDATLPGVTIEKGMSWRDFPPWFD